MCLRGVGETGASDWRAVMVDYRNGMSFFLAKLAEMRIAVIIIFLFLYPISAKLSRGWGDRVEEHAKNAGIEVSRREDRFDEKNDIV